MVTQLFEGAGIALESLRAHKVRAALTILGVAIGVMVVMVIGAFISGFDRSVTGMLEQLGPRTFFVWRFWSSGPVVSDGSDETSPWRRTQALTVEEAERIAQLPSINSVVINEGANANIEFEGRTQSGIRVEGKTVDWPKVSGGDIYPGRSFTNLEDLANSRVVLVNEKLSEVLFGDRDPIGRRIKIAGLPYEVIGRHVPPVNLFGEGSSPRVIMPHGTMTKYIPYWPGWMEFMVSPSPDITVQQATEDVMVTLRSMRELRPGQENNFAVVTQDRLLESFTSTTMAIRLVMFALSSVGLMVGGVGVVAIMMISVTERTREIGVRKALGATKREILWQFLVEASTLTLVGGAVGMVLGGLVAFIVTQLTPIPANVPIMSIVAALAAAALTGIVFGLYPASRAARLDPVEALRYE